MPWVHPDEIPDKPPAAFPGQALPGKGGRKGGLDVENMGAGDLTEMIIALKGGKNKGKSKGGFKGNLKGKAKARLEAGDKIYSGIVREFNDRRDCGFIDCWEIMQEYEFEVYAHRAVLEEAQVALGDQIAFFLHWSQNGQPQASSPTIRIATTSDTNFAHMGVFKRPENGIGGHGFIQCRDTHQYFQRDVYVPADKTTGLQQGQTVMFNAYLNKSGMPNARQLAPCSENYVAIPGELWDSGEVYPKGMGKGKGGKGKDAGMDGGMSLEMMGMNMMMGMMGLPMMGTGMDSWGGGSSRGGPYSGEKKGKPPEPTGSFMHGEVKQVNKHGTHAFIEAEEITKKYGCNAQVTGREAKGLEVGKLVVFQLAVSEEGKPQAIDITPL